MRVEQARLMLPPEPVAFALDVEHLVVVQQPVIDGRGDDGVVLLDGGHQVLPAQVAEGAAAGHVGEDQVLRTPWCWVSRFLESPSASLPGA